MKQTGGRTHGASPRLSQGGLDPRWGWLLAGLLFLSGAAQARAADAVSKDVRQKWSQARAAYDKGDYSVSLALYREIRETGWRGAALDYNQGNAEFKSGKVGRALACYRRALRQSPWDEDVRYNINYVRGLVPKPPERTGSLGFLAAGLLERFPGPWLLRVAWILFLAESLVAGFMILRRGSSPVLRWTAWILGSLFLFVSIWTAGRWFWEINEKGGVVVAAQVEARNGPGAEYPVGFTAPEGREVRILGQEGDWMAIGLLPEGYKGWVKRTEVWADEQEIF